MGKAVVHMRSRECRRKPWGAAFLAIGIAASFLCAGCATAPKGKHYVSEPAKAEDSVPVIGVGDTVDVSVYRNDDLKRSLKIDRSGKIMLPLVGDVPVAGRTIYEVRDDLQARYAKYIVNPQVSVSISSIQSQKVLVLGEVKSPGVMVLDTDLLVTDAIMKSGGPTTEANTGDIYVIRKGDPKSGNDGKSVLVRFDMKNAIGSGDFSGNVPLRNGDILFVPPMKITNVSRFMSHVAQILGPVVTLETGIVLWPQVLDVLEGKDSSTSFSVPTP